PGEAEEVATRFLSWLDGTSRPWLIVLDGLADAADMDGLWPAGATGRGLVTTADAATIAAQAGGRAGGRGRGRAPPAARGASGARSARGGDGAAGRGGQPADPAKRLGAIDLVKALGCEPLALAQASSVIASSALSCRDYREYFVRRREQLADASREPPAASITWTFCVEQADRLSPHGAPPSLLAPAAPA